LIQKATQTTTKENYHKMYENGWGDAERWFNEEQQRNNNDAETTLLN